MKTLFLMVLTVVSFGSIRGQQPEQTTERLLTRIRAALPKGWTTSHNSENAWLEIARDEAVLATSAIPCGPGDEKPEPQKFFFTFNIVAAVQPNEYHRLSAENAEIDKETTKIYQELVKRRLPRTFDRSFSPRTIEEKATVERYEALKRSRHRLPDFYYGDIGLEWGVNSPNNPFIGIMDDRIREECYRVRDKVVKLLSSY